MTPSYPPRPWRVTPADSNPRPPTPPWVSVVLIATICLCCVGCSWAGAWGIVEAIQASKLP